MAITVTNSSTTQPIPVSECLNIGITPDQSNVFTTVGVKPSVDLDFSGAGVDADGTAFTIWGYDFEVQSASDYTATTFKMVGDDATTASNFANMIRANVFFNRAVDVSIIGGTTVLLEWKECKAQTAFSGADMSITLTGVTPTVTNGTIPVVKEGYKIVLQLLKKGAFGFEPITKLEGHEPLRDCATVNELLVNFMADAKNHVFTKIPDLVSNSSNGAITDILGQFKITYGEIWRADCEPVSGTFNSVGDFMVLNGYFRKEDEYGIRRYWPGATGGFPSGQTAAWFLTSQPKKYRICKDSFVWLWFLHNPDEYTGLTALRLKVTVRKKDGTTASGTNTISGLTANDICVNVAPDRIATIASVTITDIDYYDLYVEADSAAGESPATETIRYVVGNCCDWQELYFLTPQGGIGTIPMESMSASSAGQEGNEISLYEACDADQGWRQKYGGRTLSVSRSYERYTLKTSSPDSAELRRFYRDFKLSPQRWIRIKAIDGTYKALKFNVDPSEVSIYEEDKSIFFEVTGTVDDIPMQSVNNVPEWQY